MFAFLSTYHLTRAPGSRFEYSNLGVALLAHALEKATGVPCKTLVERDITAKLEMPARPAVRSLIKPGGPHR
jgi:D-alanyl-D-alanine-carboxypeptidase/D-alanyl-D-alanine-endopeptidase